MTFLDLANAVAFRSGTAGLNSVASVSAAGRLGRFVDCVRVAWATIQASRPDWLWMRREFSGQLLAGVQRLEGVDLGLTRFASWRFNPLPGEDSGVSIYRTTDGAAGEGPLRFVSWGTFRPAYLRGVHPAGQPVAFSLDPEGRLAFHAVPDADYTIRGEYIRGPQPLVAAGDIPEMPARFHELIIWEALVLLGENDEAAVQDPAWRARARDARRDLEFSQLPPITAGVAFA